MDFEDRSFIIDEGFLISAFQNASIISLKTFVVGMLKSVITIKTIHVS